jgi:hypothetical protein
MKGNFGSRRHPATRRHTPRKRSIQYRRALVINHYAPELLDHPRARVRTVFVRKHSAKFNTPRNLEFSEQ